MNSLLVVIPVNASSGSTRTSSSLLALELVVLLELNPCALRIAFARSMLAFTDPILGFNWSTAILSFICNRMKAAGLTLVDYGPRFGGGGS